MPCNQADEGKPQSKESDKPWPEKHPHQHGDLFLFLIHGNARGAWKLTGREQPPEAMVWQQSEPAAPGPVERIVRAPDRHRTLSLYYCLPDAQKVALGKLSKRSSYACRAATRQKDDNRPWNPGRHIVTEVL